MQAETLVQLHRRDVSYMYLFPGYLAQTLNIEAYLRDFRGPADALFDLVF